MKTVERKEHPVNVHKMTSKNFMSDLREWPVAGIGMAAIGALLAAAVFGVGPAALAGAAGYMVYHETHRA